MLDQLVRKYPQSQWYTEAQFRRGEILFSAGRYHDAELPTRRSSRRGPEGDFYGQGLYKHGWSLFKQSRGEESVASFLKVLDRVLVSDGKLRDRESLTRAGARAERRHAARHGDHVLGSRRPRDARRAAQAARQRSGVRAPAVRRLGNLYISKERFQDAALAFEAFAKRRPDDRYAPSLQMRTIEAYQKGGFTSLVLEGKQAFVERYAFGSPFWQSRTIADAPEVATQLKTTQKDLAEYFHAKAQKTKKRRGLHRGRALVSRDAGFLPAGRRSARDALPARRSRCSSRGRYADAAREYERTAYDYPLHAKSAAAGYAALIAYQKHEPSLTGESKTLWHRQYIDSSLMFATSFPEHPDRRGC